MPAEDADIIEGEVIEETPQPKAEPKVTTPPKKKSGRVGWYVALLLAVFIGGLVAFPYGRAALESFGVVPGPPPPVTVSEKGRDYSQNIADLEAEARRHSEMLAQFSEVLSNAPQRDGYTASLAPLLAEIATLKKQLADQQDLLLRLSQQESTNLVQGVSPIVVEAMKAELATLKTELREAQQTQDQALITFTDRLNGVEAGSIAGTPRGRLYLALQEVRAAALEGETVAGALSRLVEDERYIGEKQLVSALESTRDWFTDNSAPAASLAELQAGFDQAVRAFTRARHKEEGSFLMGLFTVRSTGENATGDDARIVVAEKRVARGDVAGAVDEIAFLEAPAKTSFTEWTQRARHHMAVAEKLDRVLAQVRGAAL